MPASSRQGTEAGEAGLQNCQGFGELILDLGDVMTTINSKPSIFWVSLLVCTLLLLTPLSHAGEEAGELRSTRGSLSTEKDLDRHNAFILRKEHLIRTGGSQLVLVGDSITDAWRADPQREILEDYFGQYRPYNIGIGGDETQHVLWRIEHGELEGIVPKVVVVMIGTNNISEDYYTEERKKAPEAAAAGVSTIVHAIRLRLPDTKILLLGIFPRENRPDAPLRLLVERTNKIIATLDDGQHIKYLDIGAKFLESNGILSGAVMPDYLHPNARGYEIWATAIKSTVDALER
jgi:lysophospholipase L1-like esterase